MKKPPHWHHLCGTHPEYFEAWEQGVGPGQTRSEPARKARPCSEKKPPSLVRQAWNLTQSLAAFVSDGCTLVDADEYARRLSICDGCEYRRNNRCLECGCRLSLKARGRAFKCPIGKWDEEKGS